MSNMIQAATSFFDHPFFIVLGGITASVFILGILFRILCWFFGITPILLRLGRALWGRRIAIFASAEAFASLSATLTDTRIIRKVIHIPLDNIDKAKNETVFLVDWSSFGERIQEVFAARRNDQTPVIIFAAPESISQETMADIANKPNTVVVNFRGRLLNDILTSLMTTGYAKK